MARILLSRKQLFATLLVLLSFTFSFGQNPIVTENAQTGNPSTEWDISGAGDQGLQGFATDISVNKGTRVNFKIDAASAFTYTIKVYRLGYYNGSGARLMASLGTFTGTVQDDPITNLQTGLIDCGNWTTSAFWDVPSTAVSGVYIARLTRTASSSQASHIIFVVRDDASTSDMFFQTSDATWQAYNVYGGNSLYVGATSYPGGHATKVSYNRPFQTRDGGGGGGPAMDFFFNAEYPMIRFLERNGYNISYTTNVDAARNGTLIKNHKVYLSVGHDEYWSAEQRTNVEAARNAGVNMAFFSGNEVYWKTRWENSTDGTNTAYRTLVCYKEGTLGENVCGGKCDPTTTWTGLWRDGCSFAGSGGCNPENALTGEISWTESTGSITIPAVYKNLRLWRGITAVTGLGTGGSVTLPSGVLGYEWDFEQYASSYPHGRITYSSTTVGSNTHKLSLYKQPGGGLVFGAGTCQWSWGLDNMHDRGSAAPSAVMQQATINLFADMNAQPATLMSGMTAATMSADLTAPTCVISSPANGASIATGTNVTISGTATEVGGGQLVGVEISVDGGTTWVAVSGTSAWTYSWTPNTAGSVSIKVRGFDDSGNMGVPGAAGSSSNITVTVTGASTNATTVFQPADGSTTTKANDGTGLNMGMKFRTTQAGHITGARFYKATGTTGTHTGQLWNSTGTTKLAEIVFTNESASGWQQMSFSSPVAITANTTYVISVHSSSGDYVATNPYFTAAVVNPPLRGLANGEDGTNGLYLYSATPAFPSNNYQSSNYWVDVVYTSTLAGDVTPPIVTTAFPAAGTTTAPANSNIAATFSEAVNAATVTTTTFSMKDASNVVVPATVSTSGTVITMVPTSPLAFAAAYTVTVKGGASGVKDPAGNALAADYVWSFTTAPNSDVTPPTLISFSPLNAATGVALTSTVSASFTEPMLASSVTTTTFQLKNPSNVVVTATVSTASNVITLTPSAQLSANTTYTATITGGASGVKDLAGNALATTATWTFTTGAAPPPPANIFQPTDAPSTGTFNEGTGLTLGMKFRSSLAGYITGVRYYKGAGTTGSHTGDLWSSTGTKLAECTFINESASGWQTAFFSTPVTITTNTTYIVSYHSPSGHYVASNPYFTSAVVNGPLTALATGTDGPNGLYIYSATPTFPNSNYQSSNYWVDIVFTNTVGSDVTPPIVVSSVPAPAATGVSISTTLTATFNEAMTTSTLTAANIELRDAGSNLVPATLVVTSTSITLTPTNPLAQLTNYTFTIKGGASGVKDAAGNAMTSNYVVAFTTADPLKPPMTDGVGGPILVVSTSNNPFSRYAVEILRAEGLNEFAAKDITQVTATDLNNYDVVVLGEVPLTAAQVTLFTNWVNAGGTLIGFKPDAQLASLFGITKVAGSLSDAYLLVNTAAGTPGAGIVNQTIQYHGTSDLYTLNGATSLATLYSNATTATTNPAVTGRLVGTNGGAAVAFTYDLARSIVYTRQGNPAWAGQKRDGQVGPIRSDDQYFGGTSPDYVDFNKIAIPQADEQQRLLVNIILQGNLHRKPLPRFWFLPSGKKAAIVMSGDDHGIGGTTGQWNHFMTLGPNTAQDVLDWKAIRGTSYIYTGTITNAQALSFQSQGFEVALHVSTGCGDVTPDSYDGILSSQLSQFNATYPGIAATATNRNHCIAWSNWATVPKGEVKYGMRFDVNYYYWPAPWVLNRPGLFTGSGMPMRFADLDGSLIDVYQGATQMTDESSITYSTFANALLDKATGAEGYYGVFTANMHTDSADHSGANAIIASALAHNVPVVSAKQMLTWLDGRNYSSFGAITWNNNQLSFNIVAQTDARNLQAMVPVNSQGGPLTGITMDGGSISFTTQTIKGIAYAFFNAAAGTHAYVANYNVPNAAPVVTTQPIAQSICQGSNVSFTSAASGQPVPTVKWQVSTTGGSSWTDIAGATSATYTFTPAAADNTKQYRAVWTNSQGTANSNGVVLTVKTVPTAPTVGVANNCGNSILTASNFTGSLLWSNSATTTAITVTTAGTYTVTQTVNGCTSPSGSGVAAPLTSSTPAPTVSVANNCGSSVLTASNFTGSLLWSNGATTNSITVNNAATYTVTQTVTGCTSPSGSGVSAPKTIPPTPTISANGSTTLCGGATVVLTASSATGNVWSNGATTQAITVSTAGNYSVTTTNASSCSATSAVTAVTVNAAPAGTISSSTGTVCAGSAAAVTFTATSGTGPYSVVINGTTYNNISSGGTVTTNVIASTNSLWDNTVTPQVANENDGQAIELGMKFRTSVAGKITSLRFYKGNNNDANTYTLKIYLGSSQALLGSTTFVGTTATGWQTVSLATPISVTANTTYVASYYSPGGSYAYTDNYFTTERVSGAVTGLANGTDGTNGLYRYGSGGGFPSSSYQSANYWVDVVFIPNTVSLSLTSITGANGCTVTGTLGTVNLTVNNCIVTRGVNTDNVEVVTKAAPQELQLAPAKLELGQNRPNPFSGTTLIDFSVPKRERVRLSLYDASGRLLRVVLDETRDAGSYTIPFRRTDLGAGIYYYKLESAGETIVKKMSIL